MRVLEWILNRCENKVGARQTPIGCVPYAEDINIDGLDLTANVVEDLLNVDTDSWKQEACGIEEFYSQFGDKLPKELKIKLDKLKQKLN